MAVPPLIRQRRVVAMTTVAIVEVEAVMAEK
jgi:hypothetical protein